MALAPRLPGRTHPGKAGHRICVRRGRARCRRGRNPHRLGVGKDAAPCLGRDRPAMSGADTVALVAIDAGNTRVKWGVRADGVWLVTGALETRNLSALSEAWPALPARASAIASNVAGAQIGARLEKECHERRIPLTLITSQAEELGVKNGYRQPS